MSERRVGEVTHYFGEPEVGAIKLEAELSVGEVIHVKGHTTDFRQTVRSMQIEHDAVEEAGPGDHIAVKVEQRVREGDGVFRVEEDQED